MEEVILNIDIKTDEVESKLKSINTAINALRQSQKELTSEINKGNDVNGEYSKKLADVNNDLKLFEAESKNLTKLLPEASAATGDLNEGFNEQQKILESSSPLFKNMSQRLSGLGVDMKTLASGGGKAFSSLGTAVKSFGKLFLTPPIVIVAAVLGAISLAAQKVSEAFKKSDDAGTKLSSALAPLKVITEAVAGVFEKFVNKIADLALGFSKAIGYVVEFGEKLGIVKKGTTEAIEAQRQMVESLDNLEEAERRYTVNSANRERDVAKLREQAADAEQYSTEQRLKFLEEAAKIEEQDLAERQAIALERWQLAKKQAEVEHDTSDETKNNLANLEAAYIEAETEYSNSMRRIVKQINTFKKDIKAESDAIQKQQETATAERLKKIKEANEREQQLQAKQAADLLKIRQDLEDLTIDSMEEGDGKQIAQLTLRYEREKKSLLERLENDKTLTLEAKEALNDLLLKKEEIYFNKIAEIQDKAMESARKREEEDDAQRLETLKITFENRRKIMQDSYEVERLQAGDNVREVAAITLREAEEALEMLKSLTAEGLEALSLSELEYSQIVLQAEENVKRAKNEVIKANIEETKSYLEATGTVLNGLTDMLDSFGEENEAAARASKIVGLAQIAVKAGVAVAEAVASAAALPFPANLASIATAIATVMSSIGSAYSLINSAKFETGGIVGGSSYTGDKNVVRVNSGEMILNRQQQAELFKIANTGVQGDTQAIVSAIRDIQQPVLSYREFNNFKKSVEYKERKLKIN